MSARGVGDHETDELIAAEPGLERVVTALAADGDATELLGRQAALTMFRTVRDAQPSAPASATASPGSPGPRAAGRLGVPRTPRTPRTPRFPRLRGSSRLSFPVLMSTAAALVAVVAAATTAAYVAALPTPVQQIAHSVFAPLGIPTAPPPAPQSQPPSPGQGSGPASGGAGGHGPVGPGSPASVTPSGSPGPGASTRPPNGATQSPSASPTVSASGSPTTSPTTGSPSPGTGSLTLTAATAHVAPGGQDTFTAQLTQAAQPVAQISVQLLEHDAGVAGLRVAATGVTGADGTVTLTATGLTVNAIFHVAGTGQFNTVASPKVTVEVIPGLVVHLSTATTLMVHALAPAASGDIAVLQRLSGGAWVDVTTRGLGPQERATFPVVSGQTYRVALRATITHGRAVSESLTA